MSDAALVFGYLALLSVSFGACGLIAVWWGRDRRPRVGAHRRRLPWW